MMIKEPPPADSYPVRQSQLIEDVINVKAHRETGQVQPESDLVVGQCFGYKPGNLKLPGC
jgi:hypothetical protein